MKTKRTHIFIPAELAGEIERVVGKRGRSSFMAQAARRELKRLRLLKALERAAGSWKDRDHPELKSGASKWVDDLRTEDERRLRRLTSRSNG